MYKQLMASPGFDAALDAIDRFERYQGRDIAARLLESKALDAMFRIQASGAMAAIEQVRLPVDLSLARVALDAIAIKHERLLRDLDTRDVLKVSFSFPDAYADVARRASELLKQAPLDAMASSALRIQASGLYPKLLDSQRALQMFDQSLVSIAKQLQVSLARLGAGAAHPDIAAAFDAVLPAISMAANEWMSDGRELTEADIPAITARAVSHLPDAASPLMLDWIASTVQWLMEWLAKAAVSDFTIDLLKDADPEAPAVLIVLVVVFLVIPGVLKTMPSISDVDQADEPEEGDEEE